jgi:putative ABC transport system substrate-binding protein
VTTRRAFIGTLAGGLLAAPLAAEAQQRGKVPRVGYLAGSRSDSQAQRRLDAFRQGLRELGYVEGQNITIEERWADEKVERLPNLAAELVQRTPDVIVSSGNAAVAALKQATQTIPIVVGVFGDPVGSGFIASLARPGGNITGLSNNAEEMNPKWLELLKEVVPRLSRVAVLWGPSTPSHHIIRQGIESTGQTLGVTAQFLEVGGRDDVTRAFAALTRARAGALIALPQAETNAHRRLIMDLAAKNRLPGMYPFRNFVEEGGLMSYGPNTLDMFRRAATYVDKILKGAKPADLPVEQPTKFELVINLKTAKALGLTIPPSLLQRADEVIQ